MATPFGSVTADTQLDERRVLKEMVEHCGGVYDDDLDRRYATFLLSKSLSTDKTRQSFRWGIPVLSHQWLFDCLYEQRLLSITPYLLNRGSFL